MFHTSLKMYPMLPDIVTNFFSFKSQKNSIYFSFPSSIKVGVLKCYIFCSSIHLTEEPLNPPNLYASVCEISRVNRNNW